MSDNKPYPVSTTEKNLFLKELATLFKRPDGYRPPYLQKAFDAAVKAIAAKAKPQMAKYMKLQNEYNKAGLELKKLGLQHTCNGWSLEYQREAEVVADTDAARAEKQSELRSRMLAVRYPSEASALLNEARQYLAR